MGGTGSRELSETILGDILKGSFSAMVREMAVLIERTAMSPIIREKQDYAVGLFDTGGRMVFAEFLMQGPGMIDPILERFPIETMRPGDVYCYNDPYLSDGASGHVPDITFCLPVFEDGAVRVLVALFGHFWDLGGYSPGGLSPFVTEVFHEGILIPPVRLVKEGEFVEDVYQLLLRNTRFPAYLDGDVRACISACSLGVRRVQELIAHYGVERVLAGCERVMEQSREWGRRILDQLLPDGTYVGQDLVDGDGFGEQPYKVQLKIEKSGGTVRFDFTGTDPQAKGPINFLLHPGILKTVLLGRILQSYEPALVLNDGLDGIIDDIEIPSGSLLWPKFPAGVALRAMSRILVTNSILEAMGSAEAAAVPAASCNYGIVTLRTYESDAERYVYSFEGFGVGQGARPSADGIDSVYFIGQKNNPVEWLEAEYPFRVEQYAIARDTGGPGLFRGGVGIIRDLRVLSDQATLCTMMVNARQPARGVGGGLDGRLGQILLNPGTPAQRRLATLADNIELQRGDVVRIMSAGGGGWGAPFERRPESVAWDVRKGYVSLDAAERDYGVVLDRETLEADPEATAHRRDDRSEAERRP